MKRVAKSCGSAGALQADFRLEATWSARLLSDTTVLRSHSGSNPKAHLISSPSLYPLAGLHGDSAARDPRSALSGAFRPQPDSDAFSCGILERRGLSGSVQWQCIRNGSGHIQLLNYDL